MKGYIILGVKSLVLSTIVFMVGFFFLQIGLEGKIDFKYVLYHSFKMSFILSFALLLIQMIFIKINTGSLNYIPSQQLCLLTIKSIENFDELSDKIVKNTKWKIKDKNDKQISFKSSMNGIFSYGEIIQIRIVNQNQSEVKLEVKSSSIFKLSIFDFTKNFRNIQRLKKLLIS